MRVLVLEDDLRIQRGLTYYLKKVLGPVEVSFAQRVSDAIQLLDAGEPDFILSDFDVLGGTGGDFLAHVKASHPAMVERFIFHSASEEPPKLHHKVIEKGIPFDEFASQLRSFLT